MPDGGSEPAEDEVDGEERKITPSPESAPPVARPAVAKEAINATGLKRARDTDEEVVDEVHAKEGGQNTKRAKA